MWCRFGGYLNLELTQTTLYIPFHILYESCFSSLFSNLKPKTQKNIKIYQCIDGNNNSNYELIIDLDQANVVKSKAFQIKKPNIC